MLQCRYVLESPCNKNRMNSILAFLQLQVYLTFIWGIILKKLLSKDNEHTENLRKEDK